MKKKIMAAAVSLLMAASAVPIAEISEFLPSVGISASAAEETKRYTIDDVTASVISDKDTGKVTKITVTINSSTTRFSKTASEISVNMDYVKTGLSGEGVSWDSDCEIELSYKFSTANYPNLAHVKFTDNFITSLGGSMFQGNKKIQTVDFSSSAITKIGSNVFSGCESFVGQSSNTINLKNITQIGDSAFNGCKKLTGVTFDENTKTIGSNAFNGCVLLRTVDIPKSVEAIGGGAFGGCSALDTVNFKANNPNILLGGGLDKNGEPSYSTTGVFNKCTSLRKVTVAGKTGNTIPDVSVTGESLFSGCTSLTNFVVPNSLEYTNKAMFKGCTKLDTVTFNVENSNCLLIGPSTFDGCSALKQISLPKAAVGLGANAFVNCSKLEKAEVSDELSLLGEGCFGGCWNIALYPYGRKSESAKNKVIIPNNVTAVPKEAFKNCSGITKVDLNVNLNNISFIGEGAFDGCRLLPSIDIPDKVTEISKLAFANCTALSEVKYSKNLVSVGEKAFYKSSSLAKVTPHGQGTYTGTIQFPSTFATIETSGFEGCSLLKYIKFIGDDSSNFANLGKSAFKDCTSLVGSWVGATSSKTLKFPSKVNVINESAFEGCTGLYAVEFAGNVTFVGTKAFKGCKGLESIKLNDTIETLGESAFENCEALKNIPAMSKLTELNKATFKNCDSLKNITIPANITKINANVFENCDALSAVTFANNSMLNSIGNYAFSSCKSLASINLSSLKNLATIGNSAFEKTGLKIVKINKSSDSWETTVIGNYAFSGCEQLTSADLSGTNMETLDEYTFRNCTALTSVKLPSTIDTIKTGAFDGCKVLSTVNSTVRGVCDIPASVKTIQGYAFRNNHCLATMKIPANTDKIDLSAWNFSFTYTQDDLKTGKINPLKEFIVEPGNQNFKSVDGVLYSKDGKTLQLYPCMKAGKTFTVPSGVTTLSQSCFSSNDILEQVIIPFSVKSMESKVFTNCKNLRAVDFGTNSDIVIDKNAISGCPNKICFYGKSGSSAQKYAENNSSKVKFVDNNKKTASVSIKQGKAMTVSIKASKTVQLNAVLKTANGGPAEDNLRWSSSNENIAVVNNEGKVTLKKQGAVTITAAAANGKSGSIKLTISDKIFLKDCTISVSPAVLAYNGKVRYPAATVKNGSKTLTKGKDYKVTYKNNKNLGTATVTVTGIGQCSGTVNKTFRITLGTPSKLKLSAASTNAVLFKWNKVAGAKKYEVYQYKNKKWVKVKTVTGASCKITGLKSGTAYKFKVKAVNGKFVSAASGTFTAVTRPAKAAAPTVKSASKKSVKASWKAVSGASGYQVQVTSSKSLKGGKIITLKGKTKTVSGLKSKTRYYVRVRAYKTLGKTKYYGAWSSAKSVVAK